MNLMIYYLASSIYKKSLKMNSPTTLMIFLLVLITKCVNASQSSSENTSNIPDLSQQRRDLFEEFKTKYDRAYTGVDDEKRFKIFVENCEKIDKHNKLYERGEVSFRMGINRYGDMTYDEIIRMHVPNVTNE